MKGVFPMIPVDIQNASGFIRILSGEYVPPFSLAPLPQIKPDAYYLFYCIDGKGRISLGKEKGTLLFPPISLSLFYSGKTASLIRESETFSFYLYELCGGATDSYYALLGNRIFSLPDFPQTKNILPMFQTLQRISNHYGSVSPMISNKLFTDLFTELFFFRKKTEDTLSDAPNHVADLKNWCDTHYAEKFSLDELAESFGVSKYKLCRDFSSYFEISPLQYLNHQRVEYAKNLLLTTNDRIYEIGNAVGIENTNHFINLFKKYTGTTPNEFRHSHVLF